MLDNGDELPVQSLSKKFVLIERDGESTQRAEWSNTLLCDEHAVWVSEKY